MAKLSVELIGDASSLKRSFEEAGASASTFSSKLGSVIKAGAIVAGAGLGALALGIDKSVKAALEAQASTARLDAAFRAAGLSANAFSGQIDAAEASSRKLGFTDTEVQGALGSLITATGSVSKSMQDLAVAQDLARFKGEDLNTATTTLAQAMTGSQRAVKQLGIVIIPTTEAMDKLKAAHVNTATAAGQQAVAHAKLLDKLASGQAVIQAVTDKVHGQGAAFANTAAGGMAQFNAQFDHVKVQVGNVFLPALAAAAGGLADFLGKFAAASGIQEKFKVVLDGIVNVAKGASQQIAEALYSSFNASTAGAGNRNTSGAADAMAKNLKVQLKLSLAKVNWSDVGAEIVDGIGNAMKNAVPRIGHAAEQFQVGLAKALVQAMAGAFNKVADALTKEVNKELTDLARQLKDGAKAVGSAAESIGEAINKGILKGIENLGSKVLHGIESGISSAAHAAASFASSAFGAVGKAIVQGMIGGIESLATSAADAAANVAKSAYNSAKHFLGIGSPSKLFHEIGQNVVQGLANGISESSDHAVSAAVKMVGAVKAGVDGAVAADNWASIGDHIATSLGGGISAGNAKANKAGRDLIGAAEKGAQSAIPDLDTIGQKAGQSFGDALVAGVEKSGPKARAAVTTLIGDVGTDAHKGWVAVLNDARSTWAQMADIGSAIVLDAQTKSWEAQEAWNNYTGGGQAPDERPSAVNAQTPNATGIGQQGVPHNDTSSMAAVASALSNAIRPGLQFAAGGVVPGPRGFPQVAMVHGGETVIPAGGSFGGGGGVTNVTVNLPNLYTSSPNELVQLIKTELQRENTRGG